MKIGIIAPNDLRIYDGTTVRITGLTKHISKYLSEVLLVSKTINRELMGIRNIRHIKISHLRALTLLLINYLHIIPHQNFDVLLTERLLLRRRIRSKIDIIHAHWILSLPIALALRRGLFNDANIIVDLHGLFELQEVKGDLIGKILHNFFKFIERIEVYDKAISAFVVPSQALKEYIVKRFEIPRSKVYVIPDGINAADVPFYSEKRVSGVRKVLKFDSRPVIGYVGLPDFYHGIYDLLTAFKIVKKKYEDCLLLLIVPSTSLMQSILRRYDVKENDVRLLENIPRYKLFNYLLAVDVSVIPHRANTQFDFLPSNKILDYMATGKPIVAYSLRPIVDMLKDYPLKVLAQPNNPNELAEGLITALKNYSCLLYTSPSPRDRG